MSELKEYTGTDEQIAAIDVPFIFKDINGVECNLIKKPCDFIGNEHLKNYLDNCQVAEILIITDDPLREMKIRHAQTGQPVWIKWPCPFVKYHFQKHVTTTPDWNIPNAEYSFTPFDEVEK